MVKTGKCMVKVLNLEVKIRCVNVIAMLDNDIRRAYNCISSNDTIQGRRIIKNSIRACLKKDKVLDFCSKSRDFKAKTTEKDSAFDFSNNPSMVIIVMLSYRDCRYSCAYVTVVICDKN